MAAAVLHFVVYLPPPGQRPLRVLGPAGAAAPTNGFWVPHWGALQLLEGGQRHTGE